MVSFQEDGTALRDVRQGFLLGLCYQGGGFRGQVPLVHPGLDHRKKLPKARWIQIPAFKVKKILTITCDEVMRKDKRMVIQSRACIPRGMMGQEREFGLRVSPEKGRTGGQNLRLLLEPIAVRINHKMATRLNLLPGSGRNVIVRALVRTDGHGYLPRATASRGGRRPDLSDFLQHLGAAPLDG